MGFELYRKTGDSRELIEVEMDGDVLKTPVAVKPGDMVRWDGVPLIPVTRAATITRVGWTPS